MRQLQLARELGCAEEWLGSAQQQAADVLQAIDNAPGSRPDIVARLSYGLLHTLRAHRHLNRPSDLGWKLELAYDPVHLGKRISGDDVESDCSLLMGHALSRALLAAVTESAKAKDLTAKFSTAYVRAAGIAEAHYFPAPDTLTSTLASAVQALGVPKSVLFPYLWASSVANRLWMTAEPVFDRRKPLTPSSATFIRLAALCLAAEADAHHSGRHGVRFRRIAAGVTLLQRRVNGVDPAVEMIMLASD